MKKKVVLITIIAIALCAGFYYLYHNHSVSTGYKACKTQMISVYPGQSDMWGNEAQHVIDTCMYAKGFTKVIESNSSSYWYK